jgi:DNA polymerase V
LNLEEIQTNKSIVSSRSFGRPVILFEELAEAVSYHVARAAMRLREQETHAQCLTVEIKTNLFKIADPYYKGSQTIMLPLPTFDTGVLIKAAKEGLKSIFKKGEAYKKAGIVLSQISSQHTLSNTRFPLPAPDPQIKLLLKSIDLLNLKWGRDTVTYGAQGLERPWQMNASHRSPRYTTCLEELPKVR